MGEDHKIVFLLSMADAQELASAFVPGHRQPKPEPDEPMPALPTPPAPPRPRTRND